ncbi:MAG: histidinol-phosphatase [Silicimonas sp.]|nr:histidinol-phosphatase [Silicimonas sp.]
MTRDSSDLPDLWPVAEALAETARRETLAHFRGANLLTESKRDDFDPVTVADRNAEAAMRALLQELRPDDGIIGEEHGTKQGHSGLTWVLDPIDGTRGYISGTPTWGVLISVADAQGPFLGIIDQPYIGERFSGGVGRSNVSGPLGTHPLKTKATEALSEATLFTTFPEVGSEDEGAAFRRVSEQVQLTRYGCDCYAYALLAAGQIDLVIEAGLNVYDVHAPIAVIESAGGMVTDWAGGPAHRGGRVLAAATPALHSAALSLLGWSE